ncbi:hypothetical protein HPL003_27335 [Paenibacillus terrae HPL-003]|uniref:Uncharacterized protein n=1 Tax=Paenibacillus terrae (strain HPL-003) TaxID=985665 RepID=G7VSH0_PAETH|nr:hypothetical protein HPL003_27335 [Paenibacillus terrae HPL-003]
MSKSKSFLCITNDGEEGHGICVGEKCEIVLKYKQQEQIDWSVVGVLDSNVGRIHRKSKQQGYTLNGMN